MKDVLSTSLAVILACTVPLGIQTGCGPGGEEAPVSLSWGVRATQGTTYVMDLALLKMWEEKLGIRCFSTQVASSVAAFPRMKSGRLDVWKSGMRDAYLANNGLDEYEGQDFDIRLLYKGVDIKLGFVVLPRSGIETMEDLAGRTITYTSKRAPTMTECGEALLEFYAVKDKVRNVPNLGMAEKHEALIEGRIDASLEGLENVDQLWQDNAEAFALEISREAAEYVASKYPWFYAAVAEPEWRMYKENFVGVGPGFDYPMMTVVTPTCAFVDASADEQLVSTLLQTMYDNFDELLKVHPYFRDYTIDKIASADVTVPYHAGTVEYLKSVGVWSEEMEENQNTLLAELGKPK